MKNWVLVANSSYAEIFSVSGREVQLVQHIEFPEGRLRTGDILSDRAGRGFQSAGKGTGTSASRHAYETQIDPHTHEQQLFAHKIADILYKASSEKAFEKLDVISPPQFLGDLRNVFAESVKKHINKEINKEIPASITEREKIELIRKYLDLPKPAVSRL